MSCDLNADFIDEPSKENWGVCVKPPFGGAQHVLQYPARYTHRVAIPNHRIVSGERVVLVTEHLAFHI